MATGISDALVHQLTARNNTYPNMRIVYFSSTPNRYVPCSLVPESQVPAPPTQLKLQPRAKGIVVIWTPPLDSGIAIRGYLIGMRLPVTVDSTVPVLPYAVHRCCNKPAPQ